MNQPLRILLVHPGASWSTADVHNGLRYGLEVAGAKTNNYQLDVRIARSGAWLNMNWRRSGKPPDAKPNARDIQYHAGIGVLERVLRIEPDWVVIVSGMYFDIEIVRYLKRIGAKVAVLLTESPYDDLAQAEYIQHADVAWTMERTSVARLQAAAPQCRVSYLQHAWHPLVHTPMVPTAETPAHDVLFIGTGFPERIAFLNRVVWPTDNVGLYGHWNQLPPRAKLRRFMRGGVVSNQEAAHLYRAAAVNLNIMRKRLGIGSTDTAQEVVAESVNPRCMELAALGCAFVSDARPELDDLFGDLVPTYDTPESLSEVLAASLQMTPEARRARGDAIRDRVRGHSWVERGQQALADLRGRPVETDGNDLRLRLAETTP